MLGVKFRIRPEVELTNQPAHLVVAAADIQAAERADHIGPFVAAFVRIEADHCITLGCTAFGVGAQSPVIGLQVTQYTEWVNHIDQLKVAIA